MVRRCTIVPQSVICSSMLIPTLRNASAATRDDRVVDELVGRVQQHDAFAVVARLVEHRLDLVGGPALAAKVHAGVVGAGEPGRK